MKKNWILASCYVLVAGLACLASVGGISKSDDAKQALAKQEGGAVAEGEAPHNMTESYALTDAGTEKPGEDGDASAAAANATAKHETETAENATAKEATEKTEASEEAAENEASDKIQTDEKESAKEETKESGIDEKAAEADEKATTKKNSKKTTEKKSEKEKGDSKSKSKSKAEKTGTYYIYLVTVKSGTLRMYSDMENKDQIGSVPKGYQGYVISKEDGLRSLILYQGKLGYCSNKYLKMTDIPAEDYPDRLLGLNTDKIGTELFEGRRAGDAEKPNAG